MNRDIAKFESEIQKVCEKYREKLSHAELVGTLDTVKMGYHIRTIQGFEAEVPAPLKEDDTSSNKGSPLGVSLLEMKDGKISKIAKGSPVPAETRKDG